MLGRGGGKFFWVDRIAPSKKIKTTTIWKDFCDKRLPQKLLWGASPIMPPPCRKRDPPPHTEKMAWPPRTWREKTAHIKNTPHGETLPPPDGFFLFMLPPPGERLYSPLRAPIMIYDLHSLYSVCLRELEKEINKNKNFLALSFNFLLGRCLDCIKYSEF